MATAKKKSSKKLTTKQMKKTKGGLSASATSVGSLPKAKMITS
ncbi:MAG: hypothetical protein ACLQDV_15720 [Candidatus Binataceae bacterium]